MSGWTSVFTNTLPDSNTITGNTSGADFICAVGNNNANGNNPPTDNKGNTWMVGRNQSNSNGGRANCQIFYAQSPVIVGSGHQFSKSADFGCLGILAYSGSNSTPLDQTNGQTISGGTTDQAGSITPTQNNELIVLAVTLDSPALGATPTVDSGFSVVGFVDFGAGQYGIAICVLVQNTAAAVNPTLTRATSGTINDCAAIASFKGAAVTSSVVFRKTLSQIGGRVGSRQAMRNRWRRSDHGIIMRDTSLVLPEAT